MRNTVPLVLIAALAGCGGDARPETPIALATSGPAADYPIVVGDPYKVDGVNYTPSDALNYDEVGYATLDEAAVKGVTAMNHILPLPSYAEVTSLETGRTILVRVERRGPMDGTQVIALSPDAAEQLGASLNTPVRVRRVNPPEQERAMLRRSETAPARMDTPMSLVEVLRRKLPAAPATAVKVEPEKAPVIPTGPSAIDIPPSVAAHPQPAANDAAHGEVFEEPSAELAASVEPAPVPPAPEPVAQESEPTVPPPVLAPVIQPAEELAPESAPKPAITNGFVVQAGAFSTAERAKRVADAIGGFVHKSSNLWLARAGPFATRKEAEASLAKVTGKGYSGARIYRTN